ncbi:unnamed protein product [Leuciscus chuanchicus]
MNTDDVELWCIAAAYVKVFGCVCVNLVSWQAEVSRLNEGVRKQRVHTRVLSKGRSLNFKSRNLQPEVSLCPESQPYGTGNEPANRRALDESEEPNRENTPQIALQCIAFSKLVSSSAELSRYLPIILSLRHPRSLSVSNHRSSTAFSRKEELRVHTEVEQVYMKLTLRREQVSVDDLYEKYQKAEKSSNMWFKKMSP